jgi:simple sugar transport system substrate-binding protein
VNEDFFGPVKQGVRDAADLMKVETSFVGTEDVEIDEQVQMVERAIDEGYDGIALNVISPTAFDDVVVKALSKGIPVVAFNVDANPANGRLSAVCQRLYEAGRILGREASPSIPDNARILMTVHSANVSSLEDRLRGAQDVLKDKGLSWEVAVTGVYPEESAGVIGAALAKDPQICAVLGTGLADTEGAGLAVERDSPERDLFVAGFDLSAGILRMVKAGVIALTIDQQPYVQGFYPVVQLTQYCRYRIMPSDIDTGAALITKDNVESVIKLCAEGYR